MARPQEHGSGERGYDAGSGEDASAIERGGHGVSRA
jgi:hypothetical protein